MNYQHLSIEERCCIRDYYLKGKSYREIARLVGRNVSTISREIRRNCTHMYIKPTYYPHTAQKKYLLRRLYCHRGMYQKKEIIDYINKKLKQTWSPEQISNYPSELKIPSFKTIYRWIYEKYLVEGDIKVLRRKGKNKGGKETRGKFNKGKSIRKRDKKVYKRKKVGHWELDTVVSGLGKSKVCFATFLERKTRYYIAVKMPDRKAETMEKTIIETLSKYPREMIKTLTCDRGTEFANWENIEKALKCDMYFADPYCAWQKGSNENSNGLLREFYPKGRNLSRVNPKTLAKNLALINARPRKILNYNCPSDLFDLELSKCCT
ncbi:MAG: IS30 family transposase [Erysipelotrichales bacterium]|nr:IS30 family transposase [Erysipelotrichales bacterium]